MTMAGLCTDGIAALCSHIALLEHVIPPEYCAVSCEVLHTEAFPVSGAEQLEASMSLLYPQGFSYMGQHNIRLTAGM